MCSRRAFRPLRASSRSPISCRCCRGSTRHGACTPATKWSGSPAASAARSRSRSCSIRARTTAGARRPSARWESSACTSIAVATRSSLCSPTLRSERKAARASGFAEANRSISRSPMPAVPRPCSRRPLATGAWQCSSARCSFGKSGRRARSTTGPPGTWWSEAPWCSSCCSIHPPAPSSRRQPLRSRSAPAATSTGTIASAGCATRRSPPAPCSASGTARRRRTS